MSVPLAYWNGRLVAATELAIPVDDAGFLSGAAATDRVRTYNGRLFRLSDHLTRFRRSCELCRIPQPVVDAELAAIAGRLVEHNLPLIGTNAELTLVLFATPGDGGGTPTLVLHTIPVSDAWYRHLFERGATLITASVRHVPAECVPRGAKMRSRMFWWLAEQEVRTIDPIAQAFLLDQDGYVTETSIANFAIVRRGIVCTPPRATVLDGISLRVVEELCGPLGLTFAETALRLEDCYTADEAMITSTPFAVAGVSRINGNAIPWPGPVLGALHAAWSRLVGHDIRLAGLPQT